MAHPPETEHYHKVLMEGSDRFDLHFSCDASGQWVCWILQNGKLPLSKATASDKASAQDWVHAAVKHIVGDKHKCREECNAPFERVL